MPRLLSVIGLGLLTFPVFADPVNLNTADAQTLADALNGVGTARARAIIEYREQYGRFTSVDELLNVRGIGEQVLEANRDNLIVEPRAE